MVKRLIILGAGGFGRTVMDLARQTGKYSNIYFLDDGSKEPWVLGTCGSYACYIDKDTEFYPAFGNNELRLLWLEKLERAGAAFPTLTHPCAYVSPTAAVGEGTVILPQAAVNTDCVLGRGCIINLGAMIDHGCVLGDGVHVCIGAIIKAENRIPECMKIEAGEVILNRTYPL